MSSEPDYNFNDPAPLQESVPTLHLPFALLTITLAILLIGQTMATFNQRKALQEGKVQLTETFKAREPMVAQSQQVEKKLTDMLMDLLLLAKTDEDAKAIVSKNGIQQSAPDSAPTATPAAP